MNTSIATPNPESIQRRHASCINSEGRIVMYPTSLTNRRKLEGDEWVNSLLTNRRSYPFHARRWQDEVVDTSKKTYAPATTNARRNVIYLFLAVSLAAGVGSMFQTIRVKPPLSSSLATHRTPDAALDSSIMKSPFKAHGTNKFAMLADPASGIASPNDAHYQWIGLHRLSPFQK